MSLRRCKARDRCQRLALQGPSTTGGPRVVASASSAQVCPAFCNVGLNAGRYPVTDLRRSHKWSSASHDCGSLDGLWAFAADACKLRPAQNLILGTQQSLQSPIATVCGGGSVQPGLSAAVRRCFLTGISAATDKRYPLCRAQHNSLEQSAARKIGQDPGLWLYKAECGQPACRSSRPRAVRPYPGIGSQVAKFSPP